jgi:hypothetical protein
MRSRAMTSKDWRDEYQTMVDDCMKRESQLTDWERSFIDSISYRLDNDQGLTAKQMNTLDEIWEKVTRR